MSSQKIVLCSPLDDQHGLRGPRDRRHIGRFPRLFLLDFIPLFQELLRAHPSLPLSASEGKPRTRSRHLSEVAAATREEPGGQANEDYLLLVDQCGAEVAGGAARWTRRRGELGNVDTAWLCRKAADSLCYASSAAR